MEKGIPMLKWLIAFIQFITLCFGSFLHVTVPLVIAHRGVSSLAPENTMAAIHAALELGVNIIEIDVRRAKDGELVVIHDPTLNRTTDGEGYVKRMNLSELQMFDAGSWFSSAFKNERIPTLEQVLNAVKDKAILLIELKEKNTEIPTVELIKKLGMANQVIIQSFNVQRIINVKQQAPEIRTILLINIPKHRFDPEKAKQWMINTAVSANASGIAIRLKWCTEDLLELASQQNLSVFSWTINRKTNFEKLIDVGVHGIITNRPQNLLTIIEQF